MIVFCIISVVLLTVKTTTSLDVYETQGKETKEQSNCIPFRIYKSDEMLCKCDKDGNWPNEACDWSFNVFPIRSKGKSCKPNTYVKVSECKICRCNLNGKIDDIYCTDNCPASRQGKRRSSQRLYSVYGSCLPKSWYSLAPCQFCYCVDVNKLVCNTGNRKHSTMLELGSYNLTICGTDFIKEAIELVPGGERTLLRQGNLKNKNVVKPPNVVQFRPVTPTKANPVAAPKLQIQVNRESNEKNENGKDKEEYYSDSEENEALNLVKVISREGLSTLQPYEEDEDDRNSNKSNELNDEDRKDESSLSNDDNEEIIIQSQAASRDKPVLKELIHKNPPKIIEIESKPEAFKINLPSVLDKIFKMALRKSMVKLNTNTNCEPGTTQKINCNVCFCLSNGKLLCTDKTC